MVSQLVSSSVGSANTVLTLDTVAVFWRRNRSEGQQYNGRYKWRVVFKFVPFVIANLLDQRNEVDEVYIRDDMKDKSGTLKMKEIQQTLGYGWQYE